MDRATKVDAKNRGLIFHSKDRTSEVSNRFINYYMAQSVSICFSRELLKSGYRQFHWVTIYGRHACSIKNNLVV
jgi:hypothetical protein